MAILKVWVDNHGLGSAWRPALSPRPFDAEAWLSPRKQWDDEHIGLLAHPPPALDELERDLANSYAWLRDLTDEESRWAAARHASRGEIIAAIRALPEATLGEAHLY